MSPTSAARHGGASLFKMMDVSRHRSLSTLATTAMAAVRRSRRNGTAGNAENRPSAEATADRDELHREADKERIYRATVTATVASSPQSCRGTSFGFYLRRRCCFMRAHSSAVRERRLLSPRRALRLEASPLWTRSALKNRQTRLSRLATAGRRDDAESPKGRLGQRVIVSDR
jgi:hypothetical protein